MYAEFTTQSTVHMQEERHRWDRDRMMKAVKGDCPIILQFIEEVEDKYESDELQHIICVAETKVTPDEFWKILHDEVIHKVAKQQLTFTQEKADEDPQPFIKFVKQDGGTLITETRSIRGNQKE